MPWRRVVIRPDSIIRFWSLNLADVRDSLRRFIDDPAIDLIEFNHLVALSDGSEMIRIEEFGSFGQHLIAATKARPNLFQEIGGHYEAVGASWLAYLEVVNSERLAELTTAELAARVERFVAHYRDFAPILWVPFIVERRYAVEYPAVVAKVATALASEASVLLGKSATSALLRRVGAVVTSHSESLQDAARAALEFSPRRTMTEEKEVALLELSVAMEADAAVKNLFEESDVAPPPSELKLRSPALYARLVEVWEKYRWISHWGYPSHHQDATLEDILLEVHTKVHAGATRILADRERDVAQAHEDFDAVLQLSRLADDELRLVADMNYFNFMRTYRMEIKIRAQYLSIPLFREIERRAIADGKLHDGDIFWMIPPEILKLLKDGDTPDDLAARREAWALPTRVSGQEWQVLTGSDYTRFVNSYFAVIDWRENARGPHNPTAIFVGGKGAGLFKLVAAGTEPPPFFVVTAHAFGTFMSPDIRATLRAAMGGLTDSLESAEVVSKRLRAIVMAGDIPAEVNDAVQESLGQLGPATFAVRSSATVEDAVDHSWAGRFDSVLDVPVDEVPAAIKRVWASLFTTRALLYARERAIDLLDVRMAVVVQVMVEADVSGVLNTVFDPARPNVVEIEAVLGYGSAIVDGEVTPDRYLVEVSGSDQIDIIDRTITSQRRRMSAAGWINVDPETGALAKLTSMQLADLARQGKALESALGGPQDIEFCVAAGEVSIVQSRPQTAITTEGRASPRGSAGVVPPNARLAVSGLKGKVAIVHTGTAQVLSSLSQAKTFVTGNILVLQAATPAWDPVIFRASGLVTNEGGATSHAIRVSNERGIPAVVGTGIATEAIADKATVALDTQADTFKGKVYSW